jgi:hypothetical protein
MNQRHGIKQRKSGGAERSRIEARVHVVPHNIEHPNLLRTLGWRFDADIAPASDLRIVQFTPRAQVLGDVRQGAASASPGSAERTLVVSDIEVAYDELVGRGVDQAGVARAPVSSGAAPRGALA